MEIRKMNNEETKEYLLEWCKSEHGIWEWPTDACGYDQHIKFVEYRNENWKGGTYKDFLNFVKRYAEKL